MNLAVGLLAPSPAWRILLGQMGAAIRLVTEPRHLQNLKLLVIGSPFANEWRSDLQRFLDGGGGMLAEADIAAGLAPVTTTRRFVHFVEPRAGGAQVENFQAGFVGRSLLVPDGATTGSDQEGRNFLALRKVGGGLLAILPVGWTETVVRHSVVQRNFPTSGPIPPSERVARSSNAAIRSVVEWALGRLCDHAEIPMVTLHPFPSGAPSLFAFRIDTDFASRENVLALYAICRRAEIPATWFVETASAKGWLDEYGKMEGQEIAFHCFRHRVWRDFSRNAEDIREGLNLLSAAGLRPTGYAAPFGLWNPSLARAVEHHGFSYASEFSLDYDDLPFFPHLGDRPSAVLQVPIHPIAPSRLRNARHSLDAMKNYYRTVLDHHASHRLPFFVYHHPSHQCDDVLNWLFAMVKERQIPAVRLGDYASWWWKREALDWSAALEDGVVSTRFSNDPPPGLHLCFRRRGEEAIAPSEGRHLLATLPWRPVPFPEPSPTPLPQLLRYSRKNLTNDLLHLYWRGRT